MEVEFGSSKLRKCYEDIKTGVRQWGEPVAKRYVQRIQELQACESVEDIRKLPHLKFHPLKGDLDGLHSIHLNGSMRLIVSIEGESRDVVRIEEVSNHYGD